MNVTEYRDARDRMEMALAQLAAAFIMLGDGARRAEAAMSRIVEAAEL